MKVLKICVSVICTIILTVSIMLVSGLLLVRGAINKDTLMEIIMPSTEKKEEETSYIVKETELAYVEVAYTKDDLKNMDYSQLQSISGDINQIHEILDSTFVEQGLPTELIDYIVEDAEYQETVSTFLEDYLAYQTGNGPKPEIDQNKVNTVLNNNIAKYEEDTGAQVNTEKIEEIVEKVSVKIDEVAETVTGNDTVKKVLNIVFSKKLLFGLIINALIWAVILVVINLNTNILYYLGATSLLHGFGYLAAKIIIKLILTKDIPMKNIVVVVNNAISSTMKLYIVISVLLGIILIGAKIILNITSKKKLPE